MRASVATLMTNVRIVRMYGSYEFHTWPKPEPADVSSFWKLRIAEVTPIQRSGTGCPGAGGRYREGPRAGLDRSEKNCGAAFLPMRAASREAGKIPPRPPLAPSFRKAGRTRSRGTYADIIYSCGTRQLRRRPMMGPADGTNSNAGAETNASLPDPWLNSKSRFWLQSS